MASPFSIFRKNQRLMLAVLGVLVMGGFVVLPIVLKTMDGGRQRANPVVVSTTKYGDVNEQGLQRLRQSRQTVLSFLQRVGPEVVTAGGTGRTVQAYVRAFGPMTEEAIVDTWLLAHRAEDLGLIVTDEAINDFLYAELLENRGASIDVAGILRAMQLSDVRLFELLRQELLALRLQTVFGISMAGVTPAERWDYYQRLNRKVAIETIAIPVEWFVAQIEDPDDETLRKFFEDHKAEEYNPALPDPGFRVPKKIAVQYFKGQYDQAIDLASIPASEVEAYYEENKEALYKRVAFTLDEEEEPRPGLGSVPGLDDGRESLPGLFENGQYATPLEPKTEPLPEGLRFPTDEPAQPAAPEKPTEKPAQPTEKPAGNAPVEPSEKPETPAEPAADDEKPPESDDGAAAKPISPFVLATYRQEKADEENAATPPPPKEEKTPADTPPTGEETGATPEEGAEAAPEKSADKSIDEVVDSILGEKVPGEKETEYRPLAEVEDEIRRTLAREKFQNILDRLRERMTTYRNANLRYDVDMLDTEKETAPKPPEKLDFPALAKENGLSAHETGLIPTHEAVLTDIGKSTTAGGTSFVNTSFDALPEFRPATTQDDEGNEYLFWKTEETEGRVPEFDDEGIRDEVLRAWKIVEARENVRRLAAILADELGKKLEGSPDQSLAAMSDADFKSVSNEAFKRAAGEDVFPHLPEAGPPDLHVIETEPFSWMTYGSNPPYQAFMYQVPPWLGEIKTKIDETEATPAGQDAVAMPGDDFMRAVYALEQGAIGVAMNRPMTAAYVVRVAESNPSKEVLWGTFLVDMKLYATAYSMMAGSERREIAEAWRNEIKTAAGFKWERQPRRDRSR